MTTILCTHCCQPVRLESAEDASTLGAVFCSDRCQELDAVRQAAPAKADGIRVLVAIVHNQPTVSREVAQSFIAMGWGNRVQKAKDAYGIAAIDMAWFTKAPRVDDLRNMALFQAMADGFTHVLFLDADMLHPDDLFLRILKYCDRPYVVSGFYTQRQYPFAPIALRDGQLHESGRYSSYRHDDDYREVDADGLRDEEVVGMGCCLIPLAAVRRSGRGRGSSTRPTPTAGTWSPRTCRSARRCAPPASGSAWTPRSAAAISTPTSRRRRTGRAPTRSGGTRRRGCPRR
jgi:endogenous inhibitor of DNA gyrase (YacG/DUF329 family)